eukprot:scaffold12939_cov97-Isochrysis_galbana.AAC.4
MVMCAPPVICERLLQVQRSTPSVALFLCLPPPPPPECRTLRSAGSKGPSAGPQGPAQGPAAQPSRILRATIACLCLSAAAPRRARVAH